MSIKYGTQILQFKFYIEIIFYIVKDIQLLLIYRVHIQLYQLLKKFWREFNIFNQNRIQAFTDNLNRIFEHLMKDG